LALLATPVQGLTEIHTNTTRHAIQNQVVYYSLFVCLVSSYVLHLHRRSFQSSNDDNSKAELSISSCVVFRKRTTA